MKLKIYQLLVNRVPSIRKKYHSIRQQKRGMIGRLYAWIALLWMNITWIFTGKKQEDSFYDVDKGKKLSIEKSESSISLLKSPEEFAKHLKEYDVISFDIFDTLIFRPFSCPTDLFFVVGEKLKYMDFERIRKEMEWKARQKTKVQIGTEEITLEQIYEQLEEQAGIPKEKGMQIEIETELNFCFANLYMLEVFKYLKDCGKKIICISDMYLPHSVIQQMVENCGFEGISEYFISYEYQMAKGNGTLFQKVKGVCGTEKTYIHVGDNVVADVEWAKKSGFDAIHYHNVNYVGMGYRASDMSTLIGSLYSGIVNAHIHNGLKAYSKEYELGFIYGGLLVYGYCQWIHQYVKQNNIDKILFLSRDGDILNQVYTMLYPNETVATEYVYWSRLTATKLSASYFKYDYFRRFLDHKVNQNYSLEQIFQSMELEDMLLDMCKQLKLSYQENLTDQNITDIKQYLIAHWEEVLAHYEEQQIAGKLYYGKVLSGCKQVVAVDVGWAGSGAVALNYVVNELWNLNCEVIGLVAGTNSMHNTEPNMSEAQLQSGKLVSYMFSQGHNREIWKWHDASKGHNLGIELLCSSMQGSLKGFYLDENKECQIRFKNPDVNETLVKEIQKGIKEFVLLMNKVLEKGQISWEINGADAYAPIKLWMRNQKNLGEWLEENFEVNI